MSTANLNWVDIIFLCIFFFSILSGFIRGFIRELISLITLVAAFYVAIIFSSSFAEYLLHLSFIQNMAESASQSTGSATPVKYLALGISFGILFAATTLAGSLIGMVFSSPFSAGVIGLGNRLLGGLFGFVRAYLICLVIIFVLQLTPLADESWWRESKIVASYQPAVAWLGKRVSPLLEDLKSKFGDSFKSVSDQFQNITNFNQ